ncbi:MAG: maleylpyruvate isomerase family mycothiol-dependent enzyme [Nocardioides sp.]
MPADHLRHLHDETTRFREVMAGCDPAARVPSCPDWDAADLLWHLARVQAFWATIVAGRPAGPDRDDDGPERPDSHAGLLAALDAHAARLEAALRDADPTDAAWSWSVEQTVGFTYRRQAHEALVHRVDAEQAAGLASVVDPALAADGVAECLEVMYGAAPAWGTWKRLPHHVRLDCTDTGDAVWVQLGRLTGTDPETGEAVDEDDIRVVSDPGTQPDAVVAAPASTLDLWLWRRVDDSGVTVHGDRGTYERFRVAVDHPL